MSSRRGSNRFEDAVRVQVVSFSTKTGGPASRGRRMVEHKESLNVDTDRA
jgi:hypothetical protein